MTNINIEVIKTVYNPLLGVVPVVKEGLDYYIILREQKLPKNIAYNSKEEFKQQLDIENKKK